VGSRGRPPSSEHEAQEVWQAPQQRTQRTGGVEDYQEARSRHQRGGRPPRSTHKAQEATNGGLLTPGSPSIAVLMVHMQACMHSSCIEHSYSTLSACSIATHRGRQVVKAQRYSVHKRQVVQALGGEGDVGSHPVAAHVRNPALCVVVSEGHRFMLGVFGQTVDIDLDSWGGLQQNGAQPQSHT